jgi:ketosteroid isomerase-like protein
MSQQNVELVRRWFQLFDRGEMEAALQHVDPAIETIEGAELPGAARYLGHAGLATAYDHWAGQWDHFRMELNELIDAGSDVVAITRHHGTGRASGVAVAAHVAYVFTVKDDKLVRLRVFNTKAQALEAVGLREQAISPHNVDVVRRSFEAFDARDVDDLVNTSDPEAEWLPFPAQLEGIVYRGHEGIRQFVRDMDEDWEAFRIEPLELHNRGERVAVIGRVRALGRHSTLDIDSLAGFVFELRGGRIRGVTSHSNPDAALEAVGLRDSGMSLENVGIGGLHAAHGGRNLVPATRDLVGQLGPHAQPETVLAVWAEAPVGRTYIPMTPFGRSDVPR